MFYSSPLLFHDHSQGCFDNGSQAMPAFPNGGEEVVVPQRAARASVWSGPYFDVFILKNERPRPQPEQTSKKMENPLFTWLRLGWRARAGESPLISLALLRKIWLLQNKEEFNWFGLKWELALNYPIVPPLAGDGLKEEVKDLKAMRWGPWDKIIF